VIRFLHMYVKNILDNWNNLLYTQHQGWHSPAELQGRDLFNGSAQPIEQ
jgi:hypothetical protein